MTATVVTTATTSDTDTDSVLRVAKWSETFETAKSRGYQRLDWVSVPVDLDSSGRLQMVEDFDTEFAAIYGAWITLVLIAARCPTRGVLANSKGHPISTKQMSLRSHVSDTDFDRLIEWCLRPEIGWLERVPWQELGESPPSPQRDPAKNRAGPLHNKTRQDPDKTKHNDDRQTDRARTGRSSVDDFGSLGELDWEEVERQCLKFRKITSTSKSQVPPNLLVQLAIMTAWKCPALAVDVAHSFRGGNVLKPSKYVEAALRTSCEENEVDFVEFRNQAIELIESRKVESD